MKTLNQLVTDYTNQLRQGELRIAYKGILDYLGKLRSEFAEKHPCYETGSNIYQGYMDMSYFSLNTERLKEKGLKVAIVYLNEKSAFEIWLSARNREILKKYKTIISCPALKGISVFHDADNEDAVIECTLTPNPDFDDQISLTEEIKSGTEKFIAALTGLL